MRTEFLKHPAAWPTILFCFALAVRLIYLGELPANPLFDNIPNAFDHYNFDIAAQNLANGDWLAHAPNNSYAPLYKYFIGAIYWLFGRNFYAVFGIQFAMGSLAAVLIFLIGRDLFGFKAGLFAFLGFSLFTAEIIYEGILLRAAFIAFWGVLSLYLLLRLRRQLNPTGLVWATLALSMFFQGRPNTMLCLPFVYFFLSRHAFASQDAGARRRFWLIFNAVLYGSFIPLLVQCYLLHGKFVFFDASGPHTFISGNLIGYSGVGFNSTLVHEYQQKNILGYGSNIKFLIGHVADAPWEFLKLYLRKIYFFFNDFEAPSNLSVYLYREFSRSLDFTLTHFSVLSSLGLMGGVAAVKKRKDVFLLYAFAFALTASVVLFLNESRYRIPAVPCLAIFAGYALAVFTDYLKAGKYARSGAWVLVFLALFYAFSPTKGLVPIRAIDLNSMAQAYYQRNDVAKLGEFLDRAWGQNPNLPEVLFNKGLYFFLKEDWERALFFLEKARKRGMENDQSRKVMVRCLLNLANPFIETGEPRRALPYLQEAASLDSAPYIRHNLAYGYWLAGERDKALFETRAVLKADPEFQPSKELLEIIQKSP